MTPFKEASGALRGPAIELSDFSSVRLDEVLPDEAGCSHELRLTTATVRILCADLRAEWVAGAGV